MSSAQCAIMEPVMDTKTPEFRAFQQTLKGLVAVPKKEVMRKITAEHKRRKKKRQAH